jgi:LDH2 family malate/lactate/ureidoglycolate dehydrogenase
MVILLPRYDDGNKPVVYPEAAWRKLGIRMITEAGTTPADAKAVMDVLITGSLTGIDSHGIRNIPFFVKKKSRGMLKVMKETPATGLFDPGDSWGPVYATETMRRTIKKAKKYGIACCSVKAGDWVANLFHYVLMAAKEDMIGMAFVRTPPAGAAWGGVNPVFGTNPMGISFPAGKSYPIILDFATTIVSQGQIRSRTLKHKPIPEGWLIDKEGNPVKEQLVAPEDWERFVTVNTLLPFGTYKGWGIAVTVELIAGALNLVGTASRQKHLSGFTAIAVDVGAFVPVKEFKREVDRYAAEVKSSGVRKGFDEVLLPGEREFRFMERRKKEGLPVDETSLKEITTRCEELGVDPREYLQ